MKKLIICVCLVTVLLNFVNAQDIIFQVEANSLNVRSEPNIKGSVLGQLKKGDKVRLLEYTNSDWIKIEAKNTNGYVSSKYVQEVEKSEENSNALSIAFCAILVLCILFFLAFSGNKGNSSDKSDKNKIVNTNLSF